MKFWLIADPHLEFLGAALKSKLESLQRKFATTQADACLLIGDMDSGVHPERNGCDTLLSVHPFTMWILGNHDL